MSDSPPRRAAWLLPAAIAVLVLAQATPWQHWLRYDRDAILHGEVWRLVAGHWLHLGWIHLALNAAGLALYWTVFGRTLDRRELAGAWLALPPLVGLGLLVGAPALLHYCGLSGVLHGAFAHAAAIRCRAGSRSAGVLLALLVAKVLWEQFSDGSDGLAAAIGGTVIVAAHWYGLLAGIAIATALRISVWHHQPQHQVGDDAGDRPLPPAGY